MIDTMRMRPIIVLGPERSGTSVCAHLIHEWGAYVGESGDLTPADERNPRGYWEYAPLWDFLAELGEFDTGRSWWDDSFASHVESRLEDPRIAARAVSLVRGMERRGRPWMWKDPALCHFLGFWRKVWIDPLYVVTVRHPVDLAVSWRDYVAPNDPRPNTVDINLLRWQHMVLSILRATTDSDRIFVEYEALLTEPAQQARRLAMYLDGTCEVRSSDSIVARMASVPDSTLWHQRFRADHDAKMDDTQKRLYLHLTQAAGGHDDEITDDWSMPVGWRATLIAAERAGRGDD
jgi:hypothetical protein